MAAAAIRKPKLKTKDSSSMFWAKSAPGKMGSHVPGVSLPEKGNLRPKIKGGRVKEVSAAVPLVQPEAEEEMDGEGGEEDFHDSKTVTSVAASEVSRSILETDASTVTTLHNNRKVSLRDLCVEDKKRVANLIKELAKLGEEKESAERNLEEERRRYEEQILQLVDQQEEILREREEVQKRMLEYQTYILTLKQQQKEAELRQVQQAAIKAKIKAPRLEKRSSPASQEKLPLSRASDGVGVQDMIDEGNHFQKEAEQPSKHFYLNDLDEEDNDNNNRSDDRTATGMDDFSTRVQPALSPQPIPLSHSGRERRSPNPNLGQSPRPFTTLIDKELENQKRILEATVNNSGNRQIMLAGGKSVQELFQSGPTQLPAKEEARHKSESAIKDGCGRLPPPRPPPPSHLKNKPQDKNIHSADSDGVRGSQERHNSGGKGMVKMEPRHINFPHGNLSLLTPEKNELISRFMESHTEMGHLSQGVEDQGEFERDKDRKMKHEKKRTYSARERDERKGNDGNNRGDEEKQINSPGLNERFHEENQENVIPEKDNKMLGQIRNTAPYPRHRKDNDGNHHHHHSRTRKPRRPPPPSYGPLHPPVMSSTQKSSEIADYVSVTSTEVSAPEHFQHPHVPRASSPNEDGRATNHHRGVANSRKSHHSKAREMKLFGKGVEFSEKPYDLDNEEALPREEDFLEKYRKMSPSERKRELLKQKSMLLEEQSRLRLMLTEQETQLQLKQQEAMTKMEQFQEMRAADHRNTGEMQQSLVKLESELARKEQELIQGRALLRQKKQAQAELQSEADKAFREQNSPSGPEAKPAPIKSADKEETTLVSTQESERKLSGRDGDSCVLYSDRAVDTHDIGEQGKKDTQEAKNATSIVRKLDFPVDSETEGESAPLKKKSQGEKTGMCKDGIEAAGVGNRDGADEGHGGRVDACTSISYSNLPSEKPKTRLTSTSKSKQTSGKSAKGIEKQSSRHPLSPGEKTLSVLEIINSLDDDVATMTTSSSASRQSVPKGFSLSNPAFPSQIGSISSSVRSKMWSPGRPSQPNELKGFSRGAGGLCSAGQEFLPRKAKDSTGGVSSTTRLGGSGRFGQGYYSASNVVSGITNPVRSLGNTDVQGSIQGLLTGPRVEERSSITKKGRSAVAQSGLGERDENLEMFELKRSRQFEQGTDVKDDNDVIDLILSRRGLGVTSAEDDDNFSVDLSAVFDDDADSNLDDIMKAIEEEREEEDIDVLEHFHGRGSVKSKKIRGKNTLKLSDEESRDGGEVDEDFEENGLLAMIVKNMDEEYGNGSEEDDYDNDDGDNSLVDNIDDIYYDAKASEIEDLEESQILEDVFFVH